ncbi:hypothetical protein [Prauserella endophytica]|uniref:Uncharacterized protein n=1 Tax=Prauserella endophytica TaxID=1592324 RepID=A0ABY2SAY1_9PSEU|nr:hypothetical protein [Prauserella endophytica]TKG72671.1 hypothetical protein FCN18_05385 [Prauserella endophytica]
MLARRWEITAWLESFETAGLPPGRAAAVRERLADALGLIASHDAYDHLTTVCAWPHEEYVAWASATVPARRRPRVERGNRRCRPCPSAARRPGPGR